MPNHTEIYKNQAEMYERMISKQPNLSSVMKEIRDYQGLDVADLGAGSGRLSAVIAPEAKSLTSIDQSKAMLDVLESRMPAGLSNLRTVVADHRDLPIETASVDFVVSGWSLCYLANSNNPNWQNDLRTIMSELDRILRPGGTIVIFETMGTGTEIPNAPDFLKPYYSKLEEEYGFAYRWIRADYEFSSLSEAEELIRFFFGDELADRVLEHQWQVVPECAGIWWKHTCV
ncbi:class I SAM-dependent methyltransferase [Marinicrinis lubricantis]|uniref:Methyltransferase domain-containing protein n=1 Tax=Marinicrinis lubricantis TaxID=2086470 RepID=A0ABW1IS09_9BACL